MNKRKGIGLIEVIIVLAIMGLIGSIIFMFLNLGIFTKDKSEKEYDLQTSMRHTADEIQEHVRYSTALFILSADSFNYNNVVVKGNSYLTAGWNYIGLIKNPKTGHSEIVQYIYDGSDHQRKVLLEGSDAFNFDLVFKQKETEEDEPDSTIITFIIEGKRAEDSESYMEVVSDADALNALQVIDWSTDYDKGVALAYRSDDRAQAVIGRVVLILDTSSSMAWNMNGRTTSNTADQRITILRETVAELLEGLVEEENIEITIIPFSNFASNPVKGGSTVTFTYEFMSLKDEHSRILEQVDYLTPGGGTNTGDGMRRAHYALLEEKENNTPSGVVVREYVILLVDGDSNHATMELGFNPDPLDDTGKYYLDAGDPPYSGTAPRYFYDKTTEYYGEVPKYVAREIWYSYDKNGNIVYPEKAVIAGGNEVSVYYPEVYKYVELTGDMLSNPKLEREIFVIGFSSTVTKTSLTHLAESLRVKNDDTIEHGTRLFQANSKESLADAFETIKEAISYDLWYIKGPKNTPVE